jgi:LDH2 family malate/lactate/ureidoglycolate dehydrogenase
MVVTPSRAIQLAPNDNVAAAIAAVESAASVSVVLNSSGNTVASFASRQSIPFGHKIALNDIASGSPIIRYGYPIGVATTNIKQGDHVHSHNMRSMLSPASTTQMPLPELRSAEWVRATVANILLAAGARAEVAGAMADAITEAHLRGVETHGLRRLRPYLARIRSGGVDPQAEPAQTQSGALLMIDGRNGVGHYVAAEAAKAAAVAAQEFGVALALVHNSNHFGFAGHYATMIAGHGQIGIVISNGQVCVGPEGATRPFLSNNPLAIAAPTGRSDAFLELDLATSVTSRANIVEAAKNSELLSSGLAQDADGHPTRDAAAALGGSLLAFGGQKGFALLVAFETITGVLTGGAFADQVSSKEAAPNTPERTAHTMMAIDLKKAIGESNFLKRLDEMLVKLRNIPVAADANKIRYPGERRWQLRRERLRDWIPLSKSDLEALLAAASELKVKA